MEAGNALIIASLIFNNVMLDCRFFISASMEYFSIYGDQNEINLGFETCYINPKNEYP